MKNIAMTAFSMAAFATIPTTSFAQPEDIQSSLKCAIHALRDVGGKYAFPPQIEIYKEGGTSFQAITKPTTTSVGGLRTFSIANIENTIGFLADDRKSLRVALWDDSDKMDVDSRSIDNDQVMYVHDVRELKTSYNNCIAHITAQTNTTTSGATPEMNALRTSLGM